MTPFSEAIRQREAGGQAWAGRTPGQGRIITARELPGYAPFRLDALAMPTRDDPPAAADRPAGFEPLDARFRPAMAAPASAPEPERSPQYRAGYDAGHQAGLDEGFSRGFAAATEQHERAQLEHDTRAGATLARHLTDLSHALSARFAAVETQLADELVELALAVARRAFGTSLALQPEAIVGVVREALSGLLAGRAPVRLALHPDDAPLVREALAGFPDQPGPEIVADPTIGRGGCLIETSEVAIDALVDTRWQRTLAALGRQPDGQPIDPVSPRSATDTPPDHDTAP